MLYPKNSRYHSSYHEPLFFEPSKDIADSRTQTYFHWYKGVGEGNEGGRRDNNNNIIQDKNFYPSRWPRITNNERNYSHEVFKFGNCTPLNNNTKKSINYLFSSSSSSSSPHIRDIERFTTANIDDYLRNEQKERKEIKQSYINSVKLNREKRERERWNKIVNQDNLAKERLEERRCHSRNNKPGKGFNIVNNQYMNDASGRELALIDSIEKQKISYIALKKYERINSYNPIKGIDIKRKLPVFKSNLELLNDYSENNNNNKSNNNNNNNGLIHNENSAAAVEPIYRLNIKNQSNAENQLENVLLSSNAELKRRRERITNYQKR
ncbi:hypothetical protein BCR32DRAFT_295167 [Anaeromyces robustus]|uniref:Uncharacterized protein n=1 Tax=Anaeromyces robustus TaxID=1754192 RepID=A0A1Y1WXP0_9FUNG|nr:hypothetical protein BCR32DRAFT_295167 [Anaeromyces robustus]|eukprot:ORX78212.1 hypothetical protein BCR32DRAFT_295167 [Anaeromyces robustus]